jgi:hypothetical protein
MTRRLAALALLALTAVSLSILSGCGPVQTISKEDEKRYRAGPPKTPPPEYHGNQSNPPGAGAPRAGGPPATH